MFIANLGIICFLFGYELIGLKRQAPALIRERPEPPPPIWGIAGIVVIIIAIIFHLGTLAMVGLEPFLAGGYWALFHMEWYVADPRFFSMSNTIFVMGLVLYCSYSGLGRGKLFARKGLAIAAAAYLALVVLEGYRGPVASIAISLLLIRHYTVKPIKLRWLVTIFLATLVLFAAMRIARTVAAFDPKRMMGEVSYVYRSGELDWYTSFVEMGGSFRTLALTVAYVPHTEPYWLGSSYVSAAIHVVPFLAGILRTPGMESPAGWATRIFNPGVTEPSGAGFLTSAEGYLNGGYLGVVLWMVVLGIFLRFIVRRYYIRKRITTVVVMIVAIGAIVLVVRQNANIAVRPIAWTWILVGLVNVLFGGSQRARASDTPQVESTAPQD